jgi:integrase
MTAPVHQRTPGGGPLTRPAQRSLRPVSTGPEIDRDRQRQHLEMDLRQGTNRRGQPFAERAIGAYRDAVISLAKYLTEVGFAGDFTAVDNTGTLNGYFAAYQRARGQGGTVTKQGNLRQFFAYLAEEYEIADPYADRQLVRYRRAEQPPPVMGPEVVAALPATARTKGYEDVRDTAIIRLMCTGLRREEIAQLRVGGLDLERRIVDRRPEGPPRPTRSVRQSDWSGPRPMASAARHQQGVRCR